MATKGFTQLSTYVRSELSRLRVLTDFEAALRVLESQEEIADNLEKRIVNLKKQEESSEATYRASRDLLQREHDAFVAELQDQRNAHKKKHEKAIKEAQDVHDAEMAKLKNAKSRAEAQTEAAEERRVKLEGMVDGLNFDVKALQEQKTTLEKAIADIRAKLGA